MTTKLLGILNITDDSFSDAGAYLEPDVAIAHARKLAAEGADVIDIGAASSNPMSKGVPPETEIARLAPVVPALAREGIPVSVDSFAPDVQRWALQQGVEYLNDIQGFPFPELYPALSASHAKLIVMHASHGLGPAEPQDISPDEIFDRITAFFRTRIERLERGGIGRERIILDPGMGLFLSKKREASFVVLRRLDELKQMFGLPVLVSVSRKSFIRGLINKGPREAGAASLAGELFAVTHGADYVRTHDPGSLKDGLVVWNRLGNRA
jgi:dihydropteroate synthase type 2